MRPTRQNQSDGILSDQPQTQESVSELKLFPDQQLVTGCIFGEKSDEVKYIFPALVFILPTDPSQESSVMSLALGNRVPGHRAHLVGFICVVRPAGGGDDGVDFGPTALRAVPAEVTCGAQTIGLS